MTVPVIDTHCHIDIVRDQGIPPETALAEAAAAGVEAWIQISTGLASARFNRDFAARHAGAEAPQPRILWTAGLHPESADDINDLDEIFAMVREHRDDAEFVGVGETGLDYFHTTEFKEQQLQSLERHFALAEELRLPIVLHLRDERVYNPDNTKTAEDATAMLRNFPRLRGVLHCYTYTEREAEPFLEQGWFVSYSGILTFKNAKTIQAGAIRVPLDRLMVETDAPFLAPIPHRGRTNQPAYVGHTLEYLANLRAEHCGEDPLTVKQTILENSKRFINIKND